MNHFIVSLDSFMTWDPAEYHLAMVHGIEFVNMLDNEGTIKFCIFKRL